jgi:hypothetical protein
MNSPVFNFKHKVPVTGFCLRLQVESTRLGPVDRAGLCLRHEPTDLIYKICGSHSSEDYDYVELVCDAVQFDR